MAILNFQQPRVPSPARAASKDTQLQLLQQLAQGDRDAFWPLWHQHQAYLYKRCLHWMHYHTANAEEAYSRAMLRALEKLPTHALKIYNLRSWLARLTYRVCLDFYRDATRTYLSLDAETPEAAFSLHETLADHAEDPDQLLQRRELRQMLQQCINNLPSRLQEPFVMRFCEGQPYHAIAAQMGLTQPTVRKRIQEARQILRRRVHQYQLGLAIPEKTMAARQDISA